MATITLAEARKIVVRTRNNLKNAEKNNDPIEIINNLRGKYIAALQVVIKSAIAEGAPYDYYEDLLNKEFELHAQNLRNERFDNKRNDYRIIKEFDLGFQELVNSFKGVKYATTESEMEANDRRIIMAVGSNLKHIVKAPMVLATRLISTRLAAHVMLAPINIGMGIFYAAWTCLDSKAPPYDGTKIYKFSEKLQNFMVGLKKSVERM